MAERTVADIMADDCARQAEAVARKLEKLAERLRLLAPSFANQNLRGGATGIAADIVNDYTNGVGAQGTFLWNLIKGAADLDAERAKAADLRGGA